MAATKEIPTLVIAGGGTGGHLYPGIAIARQFQNRFPNGKVHFVGTERGLEAKIVPREGFHLHFVPMGMWARVSPFEKMKSLLKVPMALFSAYRILRRTRPHFVLGVGGYSSAPVLLMAFVLGIPRAIWEANAFPGMANRILSKVVPTAFVVFDKTREVLKAKQILKFGLPVRSAMKPVAKQDHSDFRVLVFGGSQGARGINIAVSDAVDSGSDWLNGVSLVHQTGKLDFETMKSKYGSKVSPNLRVTEYLNDIQNEYAWADLVICRSGASTVAELAACRKAAVLVPFPFATDDHQKKNAEALCEKGAAQMILQKEFTPDRVKTLIAEFKNHPERIAELENRIATFDQPGAAEKIVEEMAKQGGFA